MRIPMYQIDAFTSRIFGGNPAAVCPLDEWLPDSLMQAIAMENNLAETAFFVPRPGGFDLRWFTPTVEIDLCGHATLASAYVVFRHLAKGSEAVTFSTQSGELTVTQDGDRLVMDFPSRPPQPCDVHPRLAEALGTEPVHVLAARDYLVVLNTEEAVRTLRPDMGLLTSVDRFAVIVTAPGARSDFVSRFFAPAQGVPEDPVTGSAHCTLVPYWANRLNKRRLYALQVSPRGGELWCEHLGERVTMAGHAREYMEGSIEVPAARHAS
jgi:PhzF family phenazine biosynthesis protein